MRKPFVVGILKESTEKQERRAPLTPSDVLWLKELGIDTEVQSGSIRIFKDSEYKKCKAKIVDRFEKASILVGIKPPKTEELYTNKIYTIFSHTIKGQNENKPLLKECINKKITLIDYEKITDINGKRLVYFGRFAGICGLADSLYYLGKKLAYKGIKNPFLALKPAYKYKSFEELKQKIRNLNNQIRKNGFDKKIAPFIIGITSHGNVSSGAQEVLDLLYPTQIHAKDILNFMHRRRHPRNRIYKVIFDRNQRLRPKKGSGYCFREYLKRPKKFESNMDKFLPHLNILINTTYWDTRYPRLVTKDTIDKLYNRNFRLEFIADISCDINGSIELTNKSTTIDNPVFTYIPRHRKYKDGYIKEGIAILARDNLPAELPAAASNNFSNMIREYIYQIAVHVTKNITTHLILPREIRSAVITQNGKLTKPFIHLKRYV